MERFANGQLVPRPTAYINIGQEATANVADGIGFQPITMFPPLGAHNTDQVKSNESVVGVNSNGADQRHEAVGKAISPAEKNAKRLRQNQGVAVILDRKASDRVSRIYLVKDGGERNLAIAPVDEALARMRGPCSGDEDLMDRVVEHMQHYYEQHCLSGISRFSNNPYLRKLQHNILANCAHAKGETMPFEVDRVNIPPHRFCYPKGKVDKTVVTMLGMMNKAHLINDSSLVVTLKATATTIQYLNQSTSTGTAQLAMEQPQPMATVKPTPTTAPTATAPGTPTNVPTAWQLARRQRRLLGVAARMASSRRPAPAGEREAEERPPTCAADAASGSVAKANGEQPGFVNTGTSQPDQRAANWFRM